MRFIAIVCLWLIAQLPLTESVDARPEVDVERLSCQQLSDLTGFAGRYVLRGYGGMRDVEVSRVSSGRYSLVEKTQSDENSALRMVLLTCRTNNQKLVLGSELLSSSAKDNSEDASLYAVTTC